MAGVRKPTVGSLRVRVSEGTSLIHVPCSVIRYKLTLEFLGGVAEPGADHWHTGLGGVGTYRPIGPTRPPVDNQPLP
jgi:hypothetical protein